MTIESDQPLAAVTLRESRNRWGEPLYSTLPVVDRSQQPASDPLIFPHVAIGEGYTTEIILINSATVVARGRLELVESSGKPMLVRSGADTVSGLAFQLEANGVSRYRFEGVAGLSVGFATVTPEPGSATPSGRPGSVLEPAPSSSHNRSPAASIPMGETPTS